MAEIYLYFTKYFVVTCIKKRNTFRHVDKVLRGCYTKTVYNECTSKSVCLLGVHSTTLSVLIIAYLWH